MPKSNAAWTALKFGKKFRVFLYDFPHLQICNDKIPVNLVKKRNVLISIHKYKI